MKVAIVGGGICGLSLALHLHQRGIEADVYERAPEIKELGVGITLLPHAMREFSALGLDKALLATGIENRESCFFNRFGQLIYKEERGKFAGYQYPEVGIHRGRLHVLLHEAARERLGADAIRTDFDCTGVEQDERSATAHFRQTSTGRARESVSADVVIACDGINSAIRQAVLSAGQGRVRRHQHLARRDPAQADPGRAHLYARRLDPDRQDRDLSDHR